MSQKKPLSAAVVSLLTLAAESACYTAPSCERQAVRREVTFAPVDATLHEDGRFTLRGQGLDGTYRSCVEVCAQRPDVQEVRACTGPTLTGSAKSEALVIECEVDAVVCEGDEILTMGSGRRHAGYPKPSELPGGHVARLVAMAEEEAAAVTAFAWLAEDLEEHGLDEALAARARRASADEIRHFRALSRAARRAGGEPRPHRAGVRASRSLVAVALENAVEGCVREAAGAALLLVQAKQASDARLARAFAKIAEDELAHAALSWDILEACLRALPAGEAGALMAHLDAAIARLDVGLFGKSDEPSRRTLGLPAPAEERALATGLRAALAEAAAAAWAARAA